METPPTDQDSSEVNVILLMQKRFPRYVVNCLQAAGYDELEVVALMDTRQVISVELRSILKDDIRIIQTCYQVIRQIPSILNHCHSSFHQDIGLAYAILFKKSNSYTGIKYHLPKLFEQNMLGQLQQQRGLIKPMVQPEDQFPLSVDELTCKVYESIRKCIGQQKLTALNSLKQGKYYSVIVNNHGNGQIAVVANCGICRT